MPKQTEVRLQRTALTQGAFTYGRFCTDILLHDSRRQTRIWRERVQQTCKFAISPTAFDDRDAFCGRGSTRHKPTLQFDLNV